MSIDLMTLRMLVVCETGDGLEVLREGAARASLPLDITEAANLARARALLDGGEFDIVIVNGISGKPMRQALASAARAGARPPFIALLTSGEADAADASCADAAAAKPADADAARNLIDGCVRARIPNRILVVDDSAVMRSIVMKILLAGIFPAEIGQAPDGATAIDIARRGDADIVFLDYNMPDLDGIATLAEIKAANAAVKVIVMTALHDEAIATRVQEAGADGFLRKPFYPADADAELCKIFGLKPLRRP